MTNSLDTNTQNTLPTSFRIIGFGADSVPMIDAIQKMGYDGMSAEMADNANGIFPDDENVMLILLVTGDVENATTCAKTFYQAGVLTLAFCTENTMLPKDCLDSQTIIPIDKFVSSVVNILNPIVHSGQINLDFNDISRALKDSRRFIVTTIQGTGLGRVANAIESIKEFIKEFSLNKIENLIIILYYNKDSDQPFTMSDVSVISDYILTLPEEISVIWGLYQDEGLCNDDICVSLLCSGKELK